MSLSRAPAIRSTLRTTAQRPLRLSPPQRRLASTESGSKGSVGDKGTAKVYNQDGTNPNKNLMYLGLGAIGLGGFYAMFMARPEKVAAKAQEQDPGAVAHQKPPGSAAAR